jgi:hypothetical protein
MPILSAAKRRELVRATAQAPMCRADRVWSRWSNDKVDIARGLMRVMRSLYRALPPDRRLRALSIGSSNEPQFRILEAACRAGLYLLDVEREALDIVRERIVRQKTNQVRCILGDFTRLLGDRRSAQAFRRQWLEGYRMRLVTLHHSLYYASRDRWETILGNIHDELLAGERDGGPAAIHAVLMASRCDDPTSTTWLYNHFAGCFFNAHNHQDLAGFNQALRRRPRYAGAEISCHTSRIEFFTEDFGEFLSVIWMIMLHPHIHRHSLEQLSEIADYVYERMYRPGRPLVQRQHHMILWRGAGAELSSRP